MLPKLCHLDNDLVIMIIIQYIYCVVHMTCIPYLGTFFFSRYPSVALARNARGEETMVGCIHRFTPVHLLLNIHST